ncbi:hypothetical protein AVEN_78651-1 [Araneus ventricosus]|uniref:Uncharacterized protein n=1 Tax=Araneus ventricosus TaxID=182803 RepID=A0A4Y2I9S6_ARAVE|nr:hypothetical protein AVEN_78651-1 [Araneus ventricosus]
MWCSGARVSALELEAISFDINPTKRLAVSGGLIHVRSSEGQMCPTGVVWKFGDRGSRLIHVIRSTFKISRSTPKWSSCNYKMGI